MWVVVFGSADRRLGGQSWLWGAEYAGFWRGVGPVAVADTAGLAFAARGRGALAQRLGHPGGGGDAGGGCVVGAVAGCGAWARAVVCDLAKRWRVPALRIRHKVSAKLPGRQPEPGVQVGEGSLALGSSDARRSRSPGNVPSPCSMSIGSRQYKARQNCRRRDFSKPAGAGLRK